MEHLQCVTMNTFYLSLSFSHFLNLLVISAYLNRDLLRSLVISVQLRNSTSRQCWTMQQHKITYFILSFFTSTIIPVLSLLTCSDLFVYNISRLSPVSFQLAQVLICCIRRREPQIRFCIHWQPCCSSQK